MRIQIQFQIDEEEIFNDAKSFSFFTQSNIAVELKETREELLYIMETLIDVKGALHEIFLRLKFHKWKAFARDKNDIFLVLFREL